MKLLLDIQDDNAPFIAEMLTNFKYVRTKAPTNYKSEILEELKERVDEVKQIKSGNEKYIRKTIV